MPAPTITKNEVLMRLFVTFRDYGYEGATLSKISAATGLGKASLYHHFPRGKEQMVLEVLDFVEKFNYENIIKPLEGEGTAEEKLEQMRKTVDGLYDNGSSACIIGALVHGNALPIVQNKLKTILDQWIQALAKVLIDSGIEDKEARLRAEKALTCIQGALIIARGINNKAHFQRIIRDIPQGLLS